MKNKCKVTYYFCHTQQTAVNSSLAALKNGSDSDQACSASAAICCRVSASCAGSWAPEIR
jgi:hypothetical protein